MDSLNLQKSKSWECNSQKVWTRQAFNQIICLLALGIMYHAIKDREGPKVKPNVHKNKIQNSELNLLFYKAMTSTLKTKYLQCSMQYI